MDLIKAYQNSEKKIKELSEQRDKFQEQKSNEKYKLESEYNDRIRALEKEKYNRTAVFEKQKDENSEKAKNEIAEQHKAIEKVERILYFLGLKTNNDWLNFDEKTIHTSGDRKIGLIEKFYQDEFLKAVIVIYENDKPKNKYSLVVVGRCAFGGHSDDRHILELPKCYTSVYTKDNWYFNIEAHLKDLPTAEELKEHLKKGLFHIQGGKLLKDFMEKYQAGKKELLEAKQAYKVEDFKELIKYQCKKCDFFLTERQARQYSLRDKCPSCEAEGFGF